VLPFLEQSPQWAGALIGGTLHAVGNVAGAGYAVSDEVGQLSLTVKLGRVALLAPALLFYNWLINRKSSGFSAFVLPNYLWGFMVVVALTSLAPVPDVVISTGKLIGKILLTLAMAAIGMKI
ncbi:MAG TPA: putative sulfate exporter family transporter, partial [Saprospiraceae bacterium]|nr:putative sulfate exporter family transporter [Saprospiraceae bacterium]